MIVGIIICYQRIKKLGSFFLSYMYLNAVRIYNVYITILSLYFLTFYNMCV